MEWIASLHTSEQYTEDRWKAVVRTFHITEETTMEQIRQWYRSHLKTGPVHFEISELERVKEEPPADNGQPGDNLPY